MSDNAYAISRLSAGNIGDLSHLHKAVYGEVLPAAFFEKKYDTAYTGIEHTGFFAYNKQAIAVAYYGVIPCFVQCGGETILSAQSADTMTHPDYRNKGLFVQLAELTYELCRVKDIKLLFGFPNQNSLPGFIKKLNWQMSGTLYRFTVPVTTVPLEKLVRKVPLFNILYAAYKKQVLKKYQLQQHGVTSSAIAYGFDGVLHDNDYLQYKTYSSTQVIRIDNAILWIKISNGLMIGDITGITEATFYEVLGKLIKLAGLLGVNRLHFHTSPGTVLYLLFSQNYKAVPSFPVIFKDLGAGISTDNLKFTLADIDIF